MMNISKKLFISILILSIFCLSIVNISAETKEYYNITVSIQGCGHAEIDKTFVEKESDEIVTLTATAGQVPFLRWKIDGTYEIIEGNFETLVIKIKPRTNIRGIAIFEENEFIINNSSTPDTASPPTGQDENFLYMILMIMCVMAFGIMISKRK